MDYLWSPWRYQYVTSGAPEPAGAEPCLFCRIAQAAATPDREARDREAMDRENYVVLRAERNFVVLNRYPYATGHLLIAPYEHVATLEQARTETMEELIRLAQRAEAAVRRIYHAGGVNLGFNIGQCAGAGVAGHIHMHVLPRWHGDTSFITTTGETRVLPEDLETTWNKLATGLRTE
jgi:ATP adenylyltransferase